MELVRRSIFITLLAAFGLSLAACENTIEGAGEDMQETGAAMEDAVN